MPVYIIFFSMVFAQTHLQQTLYETNNHNHSLWHYNYFCIVGLWCSHHPAAPWEMSSTVQLLLMHIFIHVTTKSARKSPLGVDPCLQIHNYHDVPQDRRGQPSMCWPLCRLVTQCVVLSHFIPCWTWQMSLPQPIPLLPPRLYPPP